MSSATPPRILVVEDEHMVRDMIVYELQMAGFDVREAGSAEDALALLPQLDRIDLLFTDIRLPGMDGWQLAENIRSSHTELPIIYASGYAEKVVPLPHSKFLPKPYMPSQVLQAAVNLGIKLPDAP